MNTYRVARRDGEGDCYWIKAQDDQDARHLVALNAPCGDAAKNVELFDCVPDTTKAPPLGFIHRGLEGPIPIERL